MSEEDLKELMIAYSSIDGSRNPTSGMAFGKDKIAHSSRWVRLVHVSALIQTRY